MEDYKVRYWGSNYERLLRIKQKYDPSNVFQCYNCVGFDFTKVDDSKYQVTIILIVVGWMLVTALTAFVIIYLCTKRKRETLRKELLLE